MRTRYLAIAAAAWVVANAGIYVVIVRSQGNPVAWWYVALLAAFVAMLVFSLAGIWPRPMLISAAVCLGLAALAGVLSIGLLLVPAVVATAVAAASPTWRSRQATRASG